MDTDEQPLLIITRAGLIPAEHATREQLIEAVAGLRESNACLRRRLEAIETDLRKLIDRAHITPSLRDTALPTPALQ